MNDSQNRNPIDGVSAWTPDPGASPCDVAGQGEQMGNGLEQQPEPVTANEEVDLEEARAARQRAELQRRRRWIDTETRAAIDAWVQLRAGKAREWRLDTSPPMPSGRTEGYEEALERWRAQQVQDAILHFGTTDFLRVTLERLCWHTWGEGQSPEKFSSLVGRPEHSRAQMIAIWRRVRAKIVAGVERPIPANPDL